MVKYWCSKSLVKSTADDVRTLSLHVLSSAGFGKSYKFQGFDDMSPTNEATSYKESLQMILDNCILLMVLGTKFLSKEWLPSKLRKLYSATVTFKKYMTEVYESEKQAIADGKSTERNLMTSLIRASQENISVQDSQKHASGSLTESEIYGNMFVFNFAGHDTTAHTLAFAVVLIASKPAVQDCIFEELKHVLQEKPIEDWNYMTDFSRLKRCLAVLMETLRLYTPVPIAKSTGSGPDFKTLVVEGKSIAIPPNTLVIPNHVAIHTHPRYWGDDHMEWNPSRWINSAGLIEDETMVTPKKGAFIAWSEGLRNCPGKKFSQVEFVATMAGLFRDWSVEAVPLDGETQEMAMKRVRKLVEEDTGQVLLLQMLHPERAPLVWKRR
jgi:cytochrome P450